MLRRAVPAALAAALLLPGTAAAGSSAPRFRDTVIAEPLRGVVRLFVPGSGYRTLRGRAVVPVGSRLDTTRGEVRLTLDDPAASAHDTADVSEGEFVVLQDRPTAVVGARTRLRLVGGGIDACTARWTATAAVYREGRRRLRLRKRAGRIVTDDRYSITGGAGTEWVVTEQCEFTRIDVEEGVVLSVPDEGGPPSLREFLEPGDMMTFGCGPPRFCSVAIVRHTTGSAGTPVDLIFVAAAGPLSGVDLKLCVTPPRGPTSCGTFGEVNVDGERGWFVGCLARQGPGVYRFRWATLEGRRFGPVLPLEITKAEPPAEGAPGAAASCGRAEER